ncbi:molybdenum cofactor guanylyltransferase [Acidicapsa ligni]|uniref:molybdenum cofactor guanylyltransferase n=1 Tax=Acidicapsa ligni TaxID=542300 RepID=UPI0021E0789A|nr:molybdenum cofactor guanylyltransferase [Acidicapsa ligni]
MPVTEQQCREPAAGFILAGGQSSRMGTDKALAIFDGQPLVTNALAILKTAGLPVKIAGSRSSLGEFAEEIPDSLPSTGPLGGIYAALRLASAGPATGSATGPATAPAAQWSVFLPVDMPLMPSALIARLLERAMLTSAPITVATLNGRMEPFPVVLHRNALPIIEQRLHFGETGCQSAWRSIPVALGERLDSVSVESLVQAGHCRHPAGLPPAWWFQSANTPAELAWLNRISQQYLRQKSATNRVS